MTWPRCTGPVFAMFFVLIALAASSCAAAIPALEIYASRYQPDPIDYAATLFVHLRNNSNQPITIDKIHLDENEIGKVWLTDAGFLKSDVRDEYIRVDNESVLWYRMFPNPVPPNGMAELIIRLDSAACETDSSMVGIRTTDGAELTAIIAHDEESVALEYVGIEASLDVLHIYMQGRGEPSPSAGVVEVDGEPVDALIRPVYSGASYAKVKLVHPWKKGSFHTVCVRYGQKRLAATIRALPTPPPPAIMGNISDELAETYYAHLFDAHIAFTPGAPERYDQLAAHSLRGAYPYRRYLAPEAEKKKEPVYYDDAAALEGIVGHPGLWAYFLEDEPDGRYHRTDLSGKAISRDVERANQFCRIIDPATPTYLQIDHGSYPRNLYIYGQIPDYLCTHAYALGRSVIDATSDHVMHSQAASKPAPFIYLNEGYAAVRGGGREFAPDEMRMEVYTALAGGAKSLQWYPAHGSNGLLAHPRMWNAVGEMNITLQTVLPLLAIGTPVGKPIVRNGNYLASSVLCGENAVIVVMVNRDYKSTEAAFIKPEETPATVRARVPAFISASKVLRLRPDGPPMEIDANISGSSVTYEAQAWPVDMVVICGDEALSEELQMRYTLARERFRPSPEPR